MIAKTGFLKGNNSARVIASAFGEAISWPISVFDAS
jgi:hypothetical protein